MSPPNPWVVLGIEPTLDVTAIRRAYAAVLKRTNPDDDPVGFATLRQAYEQVLARARAGASRTPAESVATDARLVAPADAPLAAPPAETPDVEQLRVAFLALQRAVTGEEAPSLEALREALAACLSAPALENLSVRLEFEPAMVRFLTQTLPRTQYLLDTVIERWNWRERRRTNASVGITTLVAHADNLRKLDNLQYSEPRVYRALTEPPRAWRLWPQIVVFRLDKGVGAALAEFQGIASSGIDPRALNWWTTFYHRPNLRPGLLRLAANLALLAMIFTARSSSNDIPWGDVLWNGLYGCGIGLAIAVLWLLLVDGPRYFLTHVRDTERLNVRLGWAPAGLLACLAAAMLPDHWGSTVGVLVVTVALVLWSAAMRPDLRARRSVSPWWRVGMAVITNVPLGAWWFLLATETPMPPTGAMSIALAGTLAAVALGQPLLWAEFQHGFPLAMRQRIRLSLGAAALLLAVLLYATPIALGGSHLLLMGLVILVIAHRTAAVNLSRHQLLFRHYFSLPPALVMAVGVTREDGVAIARLGGMFFMLGVALSMAACFYNDWKAGREASASPA